MQAINGQGRQLDCVGLRFRAVAYCFVVWILCAIDVIGVVLII